MPPVEDHPVHPSTVTGPGHRYGCHDRKPFRSTVWGAEAYFSSMWPFTMSTDCMYDKSMTDPACAGCKWAGTGEANDRKVRSNGK